MRSVIGQCFFVCDSYKTGVELWLQRTSFEISSRTVLSRLRESRRSERDRDPYFPVELTAGLKHMVPECHLCSQET